MNKKEEFKNKLINNYKMNETRNDSSVQPLSCMARDEMRKIRKIFEKTFHESIDNYL